MNTRPLSLLNDSAFSVVSDLYLDDSGVISAPTPHHRRAGDVDLDSVYAEPLRTTYSSSTVTERRVYTQAQALILAALAADSLGELEGAVNRLRSAFSDLVDEQNAQPDEDDGPPIYSWELFEARDLGRGA